MFMSRLTTEEHALMRLRGVRGVRGVPLPGERADVGFDLGVWVSRVKFG